MEKIMVQGVEIGFNDLSEGMQKKLYLQNKEMFKMDVAQSVYPNIRRLIIEDRESSSSILDKLFEVEMQLYSGSSIDNIKLLWEHPNFQKSDEERKTLFESANWENRVIAAEKETDTSKLNEMLRKELQEDDDCDVIEAILQNPNFKIEFENIKVLFELGNWEERLSVAKQETDSVKLNEMMKREVQEGDNDDVKEAILQNPNFKIELETIKVLFESANWENRVIAAEKEIDTSKLNEMLRKELQQDHDYDVIEAILQNSNFKIEFENIKILFETVNWENRVIVAKEETDSVKLNEMMKREVQEDNDNNVKEAILQNPNFKIELETIKVLFESEDWENRLIAAKEGTDASKLNEMLRKELQGENDNDVIEAILQNSNFKIEFENIKILFESVKWENRVIAAKKETDASKLNEMLRNEVQGEEDVDVIEAIKNNQNFKTDV